MALIRCSIDLPVDREVVAIPKFPARVQEGNRSSFPNRPVLRSPQDGKEPQKGHYRNNRQQRFVE